MQSEKRDEWSERISDWRRSGLSQSAYCRENELSLPSFGYWKRKLELKTGRLRLVPIGHLEKKPSQSSGEGLRLEYRGAVIDIRPDTDMDTLCKVIDVLRVSTCGR